MEARSAKKAGATLRAGVCKPEVHRAADLRPRVLIKAIVSMHRLIEAAFDAEKSVA